MPGVYQLQCSSGSRRNDTNLFLGVCIDTAVIKQSVMASRKRKERDLSDGNSLSSASKKRSILYSKLDSLDAENSKARKFDKRSVFCPHCDCCLSVKTFRKHKTLYYNSDEEPAWEKAGGSKKKSAGTYIKSEVSFLYL